MQKSAIHSALEWPTAPQNILPTPTTRYTYSSSSSKSEDDKTEHKAHIVSQLERQANKESDYDSQGF